MSDLKQFIRVFTIYVCYAVVCNSVFAVKQYATITKLWKPMTVYFVFSVLLVLFLHAALISLLRRKGKKAIIPPSVMFIAIFSILSVYMLIESFSDASLLPALSLMSAPCFVAGEVLFFAKTFDEKEYKKSIEKRNNEKISI